MSIWRWFEHGCRQNSCSFYRKTIAFNVVEEFCNFRSRASECWHEEKCIILRNTKLNNFLRISSSARWLILPYDRTTSVRVRFKFINLHASESRQGISSSYSSDKFVSFKIRQNQRKITFFTKFSNLHSIARRKPAESV